MFSLMKLKDSITKPLMHAVEKSTRQSSIATGNDRKVEANMPKHAKKIKRNSIKRTVLTKLPVKVSAL